MINIFFFELVTTLSAIHYIVSLLKPSHHLLLFMDSLDFVAAFDSLLVLEPLYNKSLLGAAGLILCSGIDICIQYINGKDNIQADMLFQLLLDEYHHKFPADCICTFTPPRDLLPVQWRQSF
ncbi:uncharacterized protein BT62DRAFT_886868 [Guyanagaster necrorhizus]|uniref:Uncharacterized protein n=1 Tax=Guyanagaster necrorhizus TaxID=856835 RepID=A0A9P7W0W1_9AGAR|nr:uncharacterized protein BT62DRAFT_886868 [Guyanagaster necrorhizus MCA 3950]KAG7450000.1 hypothetical protein BT62DRAFT_886868 [Guyanagaster necrorhizus MCA 3950]